MVIKGIRNQFLEFNIIDYELPENLGPSYEANFLYIELNVESDFGNWKTDNCALSTTDIEEIVDWFNSLGHNIITIPNLCFKEKGISFELIKDHYSDSKCVRLTLYSECVPQSINDMKPCFIDFVLNNQDLIDVSKNFQTELNQFPTRGFKEYRL